MVITNDGKTYKSGDTGYEFGIESISKVLVLAQAIETAGPDFIEQNIGVDGGILAVVPGKMAIAAFAPPLDASGNSVKAQKAIRYISEQLNLNIYKEAAAK